MGEASGIRLTLKFLGYVKTDIISIIQNNLPPVSRNGGSFRW